VLVAVLGVAYTVLQYMAHEGMDLVAAALLVLVSSGGAMYIYEEIKKYVESKP
jgi:hypothetical protein